MEVSSLLMLVYKRVLYCNTVWRVQHYACTVTTLAHNLQILIMCNIKTGRLHRTSHFSNPFWVCSSTVLLSSTCALLSWLFTAQVVWTGHWGGFSMPDLLISCLIISRSLWAPPPTLGWSHTQPEPWTPSHLVCCVCTCGGGIVDTITGQSSAFGSCMREH